jgi:hypothetical protein
MQAPAEKSSDVVEHIEDSHNRGVYAYDEDRTHKMNEKDIAPHVEVLSGEEEKHIEQ